MKASSASPRPAAHRTTSSRIEKAIERIPQPERVSPGNRLLSRRFGMDALADTDPAELPGSLDEAEREIDDGYGLTGDELRHAAQRAPDDVIEKITTKRAAPINPED